MDARMHRVVPSPMKLQSFYTIIISFQSLMCLLFFIRGTSIHYTWQRFNTFCMVIRKIFLGLFGLLNSLVKIFRLLVNFSHFRYNKRLNSLPRGRIWFVIQYFIYSQFYRKRFQSKIKILFLFIYSKIFT